MRLRHIAVLFFAILLLGGCGTSRFIEGPLNSSPPANAKEEIVIWHTYSDEETRVFENEVIPAFEQQHPNIKVTPVRQPYTPELKQTIIARASSGKIPDIVRMDITWVPNLSSLHLLYPLSDLPDFAEAVRPLQSVTMETNSYQGKYYGLPLDVNTKVAIYNREQLARTGLKNAPATFGQLIRTAEANRSTLGLEGVSTWSIMPYFLGFGGKLLDDANEHAEGYLNSQASIQALERMKELVREGVFSKSMLLEQGDRWNDLLKGRIWMADDGPWFYTILSSSKDNPYNLINDTVVAPFPGRSIIGGEDLVILKDTPHLQAAWTFVKWMTGKQAQQMMFKVGQIPTNTTAETPDEWRGNPYFKATMEGIKQQPYLRPTIPKLEDIEDIFDDYILQIITDKLTVEAGLNQAAAEIEAVLRP